MRRKYIILSTVILVILFLAGCKTTDGMGNLAKVVSMKDGSLEIEMVIPPERDFMILRTEVTNSLYETIMGNCPSENKGKNCPVECVSWYDALYFCNKLSERFGFEPVYCVNGESNSDGWGYVPHQNDVLMGEITRTDGDGFRLPTMDEWEYAASGGGKWIFAGSDELDEVAWYEKNSGYESHLVSEKQPNTFGLYDMSGNVWEWCWDLWSSVYLKYHVLKGGSFQSPPVSCVILKSMSGNLPEFSQNDIGFRVVCNCSD